jgi:hypothetical protein
MAPIVLADLRNLDADGRVRLNTAATLADLVRQGLTPDVGMSLVLYCGGTPTEPGQSLAVTVEFNSHEGIWVASPDDLGDSDPVAVADQIRHAHI